MDIREYIKDNILLFDGAMGTYFSSVHEDSLYKCEFANITAPNTIVEIHKRYLKAGAKAIKTNTFSLFDESGTSQFSKEQIICSAYKLATEIAEKYDAYVFCDIGPIADVHIKENGDIFSEYKEIVDIFLSNGGANFLFETFAEVEIINKVSKYIKEKCENAFIIASFKVNPDGFSSLGNYSQDLIANAWEIIDVVGFNCGSGPLHLSKHIKMIEGEKRALIAMPNAGFPTVIGSRISYEKNPQYFATKMIANIEHGVKIIGGCCGTTPEFIAILNELLKNSHENIVKNNKKFEIKQERIIKKSEFFEKLQQGKKPIAVELDPPSNADISRFMAGAQLLKDENVDLVTIADCPIARARMDSSLLACKIKNRLDIPVMPHQTCRDRNINASKALLLGLCSEEINDVLVVTGDPIPSAERNEIKTVYEFNSRILIKTITGLNQTLFSSPFYLYAALNINARNFKIQLAHAKEKVKNGAMAFFTQPVLSKEALENLKTAKSELNVPIVGGILPIVSYKNANFINSEIPGISICDEIISLYKDKTRSESAEIAIKVSAEIAREMNEYVDGFYLITPFSRVDIIVEIMREIAKIKG